MQLITVGQIVVPKFDRSHCNIGLHCQKFFFIDSWLKKICCVMTLILFDKQGASINLPSSVFASEIEEEVGLLNKAAPISGKQLTW